MNDVTTDFSATTANAADDVWIPTSCSMCYATCSIVAHRVDGVVVKIEGNAESSAGKGRLCGKGISGLMTHYDPNRLTRQELARVLDAIRELPWNDLDQNAEFVRNIS